MLTLSLTFLIAIASMINGFKYNDMDYYTHILITLCIFMCIDVSSRVKITVETFNTIANLFLVTVIITLVAYYIGPLKRSYFGLQNAICLNLSNPNAAGLWLTCFFIILIYSSFLFSSTKRAVFIASAIALLPIILATQSRNSFLACIVFVVGILLTKIFKIKKAPNWLLLIIAVLPIVVFLFYMFVIIRNTSFWEGLLSLDSIDKGIGTREAIWQEVLDNFGNCFFFGDYYKYYNSQMHNSLLTIFCRFGAPVTILSCVAIYRSLKELQESSSFFATLSLGAIFFTGCFEASVFVGIAGMYLMLLLIPACASVEGVDEFRDNKKEKKSRF